MFDIAIIGAGPAGATLARLLSPRYRVLVLDARRLTAAAKLAPEKCCGGLVAPDAQRALAALGLGLPRDVLIGPQLFAVRTRDFNLERERFYQRHYINVDRARFDNWLLSMVGSEATVRGGCRLSSLRPLDDGVELRFRTDRKTFTEKARVVVGADGANSTVRRFCGEKHPPKWYTALQEWYEVDRAEPYFGGIFDDRITDFYSWTIPKEGLLVLGTAVPHGVNPDPPFTLLKQRIQSAGVRLSSPVRRHGCLLARPLQRGDVRVGAQGMALVGEAGGWISPSSAEGLSYAFRSAQALAAALNHGLEGWLPCYRKQTAPLRRNILVKGVKSRLLFNRTFRKMVMRTGIAAIDIVDICGGAGE